MADRCYCVFEGGGAKGLVHVGALAALEKSGLELVGFAGTSAGALVAALAAAGYNSGEIFGPDCSILDLIDLDPGNLTAGEPIDPVRTPTRLLGRSGWRAMQSAGCSGLVLAVLVVAAAIVPWILHWTGLTGELEAVLIIPFLAAVAVGWALLMAVGLGTVKPVRDAINQALSLRVRGSRDPSDVTFADLANAGCRRLRIVASDISRGRLALFSAEDTPKVAVADAVAASICLPLVFKPWRVGEWLHMDGGLVSNLPVWTFDPQRAIDRDAWTAAIEIADQGPGEPSGFGIMKAAALTAIFGSGMLNTRGVERLRRLRLAVDLGLLEFDFKRERARAIVKSAEDHANSELVAQLVDIPRLMHGICVQAVAITRLALDTARVAGGLGPLEGHMRAGFLLPLSDDTTALRVEFSHGFEDHSDERLRLPLHGSFAGEALAAGRALIVERNDLAKWNKSLSRPEDRWVRKMVWSEARWLICIPFCHTPSDTKLVLAIDGNRDLDLASKLLEPTLTSLSDHLVTMLDKGLPKELFEW